MNALHYIITVLNSHPTPAAHGKIQADTAAADTSF